MHTELWLQNRKGRYLEGICKLEENIKMYLKEVQRNVDDWFLKIGSSRGLLQTR